jgi:Spy/CpxP family protein refolding chaperone
MITKFRRVGAFAGAVMLGTLVTAPPALSQSKDGSESGASVSQKRHFRGQRGRRMRAGFEFRRLNLTDEQKSQLGQIRKSHRESTAALRGQMREAMTSLRQSMGGNTFDEALVSQKLAEIAPLRAKLMADSFRMRQEMASVLTAEQKAQLEQLREQRKNKRAEFRTRRAQKSSQK